MHVSAEITALVKEMTADYDTMGCRATAREKADARFRKFGGYKSQQGDDQIPADKRFIPKG